MAQIFISYSKQDIAFARHLRALLQSAGFDVWLDEKLVPSTQWWRMLERQIKASSVLVVIMSPSSAESRWVEREILVAENASIAIFPVLLAGEVWSRLADIQAEDLTAGLNATLPDRFIEALRAVVDGRPVARTATQPVKVPLTQTTTERRLLESAMPAETESGTQTELWAKITLPDSPGLRDELPAIVPSGDVIQKSDARTTSFPFRFPIDPQTGEKLPAQVLLRAASADFTIRSPGGDDTEVVELPPDSDSRTVIFTLTPKAGGRASGRARVFVDLIYEGKVIAQIACSTLLVEQVTRTAALTGQWGLWSVPVGNTIASAGGYAAPSAASALAPPVDDLIEYEASDDRLDRFAETGMDDARLQADNEEAPAPGRSILSAGGEASEPPSAFGGTAPPPPPILNPTPRPAAPITPAMPDMARRREQSAVPPPQSEAQPQARPAARSARTINFPMAASAVAALVVVFGFVFIALNNQREASNPSSTPDIIALAATESQQAAVTDQPTATRSGIGIASLVPNVTTSTGVTPPPPMITDFSEPTQDTQPTEPLPFPTDPIDPDNGSSLRPREGVAAARLLSCAEGQDDRALFTLLETAGIGFTALEGDPIDAVVGVQTDPFGAALLLWGSCFSDGTIWVTAELLQPPMITGLLHPTTIQMAGPSAAVTDPSSPLAGYVRSVSYYASGWFDDTLFDGLTQARDAVINPPDAVWESLRSINESNGIVDDLAVLLGTAALIMNEAYDEALAFYNSVPVDSTSIRGYVISQNNAGTLLLNRTYESLLGGADISDPLVQEAIALAEGYFTAAERAGSDTDHLLTVRLNRAMLDYLVRAIGDVIYAENAEALCRDLDEGYALYTEPSVCKTAAVFSQFHNSADSCSDTDKLQVEFAILSEVIGNEPTAHMAYYWRARFAQLLAICTASGDGDDDDDETISAEWENQSLKDFTAFLDRVPALQLAIERAFVAEAIAMGGGG